MWATASLGSIFVNLQLKNGTNVSATCKHLYICIYQLPSIHRYSGDDYSICSQNNSKGVF